MPTQQVQIRPEDISQFLATQKAELEAVNKVLNLKRHALSLVEQMHNQADAGEIGPALRSLAQIQAIEYKMVIDGFTEKAAALQHNIDQLESPIHRAAAIPAFKVPRV